jgi:pimeloyl-ACP methyl ester carboxylesterase
MGIDFEAIVRALKDIDYSGYFTLEAGTFIVESYTKDEYCRLSGHGTKMLAEAMEADLPYVIDCPAILICGEQDQSGSAKGYNRRWAKKEGLPIYWIKDAGHNSNTDRPEEVNRIIRDFVRQLEEK